MYLDVSNQCRGGGGVGGSGAVPNFVEMSCTKKNDLCVNVVPYKRAPNIVEMSCTKKNDIVCKCRAL